MEDTKLIAKKRDLQGSSNARRMRRVGTLPGVIYGDGEAATAIQLDLHDFEQVLHHHSSETIMVDITVEGEGDSTVLVKDVQHHPVTSDLIHVDLLKVSANKPIQVEIDLQPVGEAEGVKAGGSLDLVMHSVAIECLPGDLVETIEVDVSEMEIGASLQASDLNLGAKLTLLTDSDAIVITISGPRAEEEEGEVAEGAEPEVITEKKSDAGE